MQTVTSETPLPGVLRPVRSAESLVPVIEAREAVDTCISQTRDNGDNGLTPVSGGEHDQLGPLETVTRAVSDYRRDSPKCHSRSSSHDSYFERKMSVQFKMDMDETEEVTEDVSEDNGKDETPSPKMKIDSSLDISEIQMNFDLEENEMKIFSEDEAMMSTSVGSELSLPRSPLDEVNSQTPVTTLTSLHHEHLTTSGSLQKQDDPLESPSKTRRMSFKEKLRKFTSPTMSRKQSDTSKMVDSGVGFDSDSCSGSFENKSLDDSKKPTKLKEIIVSALSPESLRKRPESSESSPMKKKCSPSPNASPNVRSLIKRSKIEDDASELSSINLSPSIKFIDASSSYELGLGLSSETLEDTRTSPRPDEPLSWNEGAETVRENTKVANESVAKPSDKSVEVQVQIHESLSEIEDHDEVQVGPISIIGANLDADQANLQTSLHSSPSPHSSISEHSICDTNIIPQTDSNEDKKDIIEGGDHLKDIVSEDGACSLSMSSKDESELSVSYAGATVSDNESFGVESVLTPESSNGENQSDTDDKTETIKSVLARDEIRLDDLKPADAVMKNETDIVEADVSQECKESVTSIIMEKEKDDDSAVSNQDKFAMEIDDDKNTNINKQKAHDEVETLATSDDDKVESEVVGESEECPMETDTTILSAEISANKGLYEKNENKTVFNDFHFGNFNYESDSEKSESSESPVESNTSERSECPVKEIETSQHSSGNSTPAEEVQDVVTKSVLTQAELSRDFLEW